MNLERKIHLLGELNSLIRAWLRLVKTSSVRWQALRPPTQLERLAARSLAEWNEEVKKAYTSALRSVTTVASADDMVDLVNWAQLEVAGRKMLREIYLATIRSVRKNLRPVRKQEEEFEFPEVVDPQAVEWAERRAGALVVEISEATRRAIRRLTADAIARGVSMDELKRSLRQVVGLHDRWAQAVLNYKEQLKERGLEAEELERRVDKYSTKLLNRRAYTIARTETASAASEGALETYSELGVESVRFLAAPDCCPECELLDGQVYEVGAASGIIPVHPNCRCAWTPVTGEGREE